MKPGRQWKEETLAVSAVKEREDLQVRANGTDPTVVRQYVRVLEQGGDMKPVKVARINKALYLIDGFHRLAAHREAGRGALKAIVARMSMAEAQAEALTANTRHGKPLTRADKDRMLKLYVERDMHRNQWGITKPCRTMSADLGGVLSHEAIRLKLKKMGVELDEATEFPNGYKPYGGEDEGALAQERREETEKLIEMLWRDFFTLDDDDQPAILAAVRELVGRLECGEQPATPIVLDI